jgi:GNAT superfamily N-acetyltransferase
MTTAAPLIRAAEATDIPALRHLVESAYRGDSARQGWTHEADLLGGQRTDEAALAAMIADPEQVILFASVAGILRGCVHLKPTGPRLVSLGLLAVDPQHQAGGLGRTLIAAAEDHAGRHMSAATMEMTVIRQRTELIAYYERRGYRQTGETRPFPMADPRFGLPARDDLAFVVLAKPLKLS